MVRYIQLGDDIMKFIVLVIPKFNFYNILFEDEFLDHNEFRTQNQIIEILKLIGLNREEFTCDICYK